MPTANILIIIHGMTPDRGPTSPYPKYEAFWRAMASAKPDLSHLISRRIGVQWGHAMPSTITDVDKAWGFVPANGQMPAIRDDEKLTDAQRTIRNSVAYDEIRKSPGPRNRILEWFHGEVGIPLVRKVVTKMREDSFIPGMGDVVYYCSEDGETRVRQAVYHQILRGLDPFVNEPAVKFHLFSHSMGVTVTHDFLFGLFQAGHTPDFVARGQGSEEARKRYRRWREKAQNGELRLGALGFAASQLPLFVMRKQKCVDIFYAGKRLDPASIGVTSTDRVQWKIFYDVDDMLGYATRELYAPNDAIADIQVNCGMLPEKAHTGYWENKTVIKEMADLIADNAK